MERKGRHDRCGEIQRRLSAIGMAIDGVASNTLRDPSATVQRITTCM